MHTQQLLPFDPQVLSAVLPTLEEQNPFIITDPQKIHHGNSPYEGFVDDMIHIQTLLTPHWEWLVEKVLNRPSGKPDYWNVWNCFEVMLNDKAWAKSRNRHWDEPIRHAIRCMEKFPGEIYAGGNHSYGHPVWNEYFMSDQFPTVNIDLILKVRYNIEWYSDR